MPQADERAAGANPAHVTSFVRDKEVQPDLFMNRSGYRSIRPACIPPG